MDDSRPPSVEFPEMSALRHDIRTLVGHILGYGELVVLKLQEREKDELLPDMEKIRLAANRIMVMIAERLNSQTLLQEGSPGHVVRLTKAFEPVNETIETRWTQKNDELSDTGKLLVVDDNEDNRYVLARRLQQLGHSVTTDAGGASALDRLTREEFDVVLLDIMMPDMDGREVLKTIKTNANTQHVPVIMISALDEMSTIVQCIGMGAADYLPKPFDPILLKARVAACLRDKRSHDREQRFTQELQDSYRRLKEAERLRDDLTHMIIHDLRTPLSSLMTGMQTIPLLGDLTETQSEMVDIAVEGGQKLLEMITDLLNVEKMEAGAMTLNYAELSAHRLAEQAAGYVVVLAEGEGLTLTVDAPQDLPNFEGDEDTLIRTLVNLLGNAIKFTPSGGSICLGSSRSDDGNAIKFSVTDTGDGIPTDSFQKIFEKFGQVEGQRRGSKISTGLGLTFCKMAVEAHGGGIDVESAPGQGCTFSFWIPLVRPVVPG
jgi:signal transduction histidine kinase